MTSLQKRFATGLTTGAVIIAGIAYAPAWAWMIFAIVACTVGQLEYYALVDRIGIPVFRVVGCIAGAVMTAAIFLSLHMEPGDDQLDRLGNAYGWMVFTLFLTVITVLIRQFPQKHNHKPIETISASLLGVFYVPLLFNFMVLIAFAFETDVRDLSASIGPNGIWLLVYLIVVTKSCDIGAFFIGSRFGRNKLIPRISPGKTWEGVGGGLLFSTAASIIFYFALGGRIGTIGFSLYDATVLGLFLGVTGIIGDLAESQFKRATGAKDSGTLLPGMGGLLDMLDSLLFAAPMMYTYARLAL